MTSLLSLNDDCLYALCEVASRVHPPHWELPASNDHDWPPYPVLCDLSERHFCLGWVILSHTCHRLRTICLDSPILWANAVLSLPSPAAWDVFVDRAQDRPLELCVPTNHCPMKEMGHFECRYLDKIWFAQELVHRARKLETLVDDERPDNWRLVFNGHNYPLLQSLAIHQEDSPSYLRLRVDAPNLVYATLKNTVPTFLSPLHMLRRLSLHTTRGPILTDDAPILNILHQTPLLRELKLELLFEAYDSSFSIQETRISETPIVLDHLQTASIALQGLVDNGLVLPSIRLPEMTTTQIVLKGRCSKQGDLLSALGPQLHCACCEVLHVYLDSNLIFSTFNTLADAVMKPHISFYQIEDGIDSGLMLLPKYTNCAHIKALFMCLQSPYDVSSRARTLASFFRAYSAITMLRIDCDAQTNRAVYNLLIENAREAGAGSESLMFPVLRTLSVMRTSKLYMDSFELVQAHWDTVNEMLEARAVIRRPITVLALSGEWDWRWSLDPKALAALEDRALNLASIYVDEIDDGRSKSPRVSQDDPQQSIPWVDSVTSSGSTARVGGWR